MYVTSEQCSALIAQLREEDIIRWLVTETGAEVHKETPDHIWLTTVCHGGDSNKLCYFRDTKTFYCYTHCGYISMFNMVMSLQECDFLQSVRFLASLAHIDLYNTLEFGFGAPTESYVNDLERCKRARQNNTEPQEETILKVVDPVVLSCFASNTFYTGWRDEGIGVKAMHDFGIAWDEQRGAIVIPHKDPTGNLVGIRRRSVSETATGAKYMPLQIGEHLYTHPLGMALYGLYEHAEAIRRYKSVVIFEGEKSVLKHHTYYGSDSTAVAVCGFNVSPVQKDLILRQQVEEVILAFDKDVSMHGESIRTPAYARYCERVNSMGRMFAPYCRTYALVDMEDKLELKDSPIDEGKDVFESLLRNKVQIYSIT